MSTPAPPVLDLRSASFGYADRSVVSGVDLTVRAGETLAVLGANGSGKSTLVRGLLGLTEHQGGEIDVLGVPLARLRDRHRIGYVPQRHTLSGAVHATVNEVVAIGRLPHQGVLARRRRTDRELIQRSLDLVGLADREKDDVSTLSGGQQRRVLIARALAAEPEILVMDEPTAGVDEASQRVLAAVMRRLHDRGTTMLVVTHELAALHGVATRIVEMVGGELHFDGSPEAYAAHHLVAEHTAVLGHQHDDAPRDPRPMGLTGPLDEVRGRSS